MSSATSPPLAALRPLLAWALGCGLALTLGGCVDEVGPVASPGPEARDLGGDQGVDLGGAPDLARADLGLPRDLAAPDLGPAVPDLGLRGFREPCERSEQCLSGYCVETEDGRRCTRPCNDDCPPGWDCSQVANEGGDVVFICVPAPLLCQACSDSEECGGPADLCLGLGDGTFCGRDCRQRDCPPDYRCEAVPEAEGAQQCVPEGGWCGPCRDEDGDGHAAGAECPEATDCDDQRDDVYRGAPEICDGADNDCDGAVDEGIDLGSNPEHCGGCGRVCSFANARALCRQGECVQGECLQGWLDCRAGADDGCETECQRTNEGVEACDGIDNDCDCAVDEDVDFDTDLQHCGRCGNACAAATCRAEGEGFTARPAADCSEGRCSSPEERSCGLYTCLGGEAGQRCARACEDEGQCVARAHCEAGVCEADRDAGAACERDPQCASGHCGNGFCCSDGDCCAVAADCPLLGTTPPRCEVPGSCQGFRVDPGCDASHRCVLARVEDDTACGPEIEAQACGPYPAVYCDGAPEQAEPLCAAACEQDEDCDPLAHCDEGECLSDLGDGQPCNEDSDCRSAHCANGFCCGGGECCAQAADCPAAYRAAPVCDEPGACQGHRVDALCQESTCTSSPPIDDDRGCGEGLLSDECGLYPAVRCTGEPAQEDPACAGACASDAQCDAAAHCDEGRCEADRGDGDVCDEASDCQSGYCGNGHCCAEGECCAVAADCPPGWARPASCDRPAACQGTRLDAVCSPEHRCASLRVDDDRACGGETLADPCGLFDDLYCTGAEQQPEPRCPLQCASDEDCDPGAHCDGVCLRDLADGQPCDESSDCSSGHCANRFCCAAGDCCQVPQDCPAAYWQAPRCDDPSRCQGTRRDAICAASVCGTGSPIGDDRSCAAGLLSDDCGLYPAVYCDGTESQSDPACAQSCQQDADCDPGAHCDGGRCLADVAAGGACDEPSDCREGLYCADGVCCSSRCDGLCQRCDLGGDGRCRAVPAGQDPDQECGGLSCSAWYFGWSDDDCRARADLAAEQVGCDGGGACQTAAALCPAQPAGALARRCDPLCQNPRGGTCLGTTAPVCDNVNPGTQTCGLGECVRTVPLCVNGAANACVPGAPGPETCNNLDDDCNGTVDDNIQGAPDGYEPNGTCATARSLGTIAEESSEQRFDATIYPAGDDDYYQVFARERESACFPGWGESFRLQVRLVPPQGADCRDYDLRLYDDGCVQLASAGVSGCTTDSLTYDWDGRCGFDDNRYFRVRVYGWNGAWECANYQLYLDMSEN